MYFLQITLLRLKNRDFVNVTIIAFSSTKCYYKSWEKLRNEDLGYLWEHFVSNEIQANLQTKRINYWRDKRGHEVDFILKKREKEPTLL